MTWDEFHCNFYLLHGHCQGCEICGSFGALKIYPLGFERHLHHRWKGAKLIPLDPWTSIIYLLIGFVSLVLFLFSLLFLLFGCLFGLIGLFVLLVFFIWLFVGKSPVPFPGAPDHHLSSTPSRECPNIATRRLRWTHKVGGLCPFDYLEDHPI